MAQPKTSPLLPTLALALLVVVVVAAAFAFHSFDSSTSQEAYYHRQYGLTPVVGGNYSFSPPITKYQAINEALSSGNWTLSELQNKSVHIALNRVVYYNDTRAIEKLTSANDITLPDSLAVNLYGAGSVFGFIGEVNASASNYQPLITQGAYIRYVWSISVIANEGIVSVPPFGYMVDAATAEAVLFPGHLF
jgi:hypothetical protein